MAAGPWFRSRSHESDSSAGCMANQTLENKRKRRGTVLRRILMRACFAAQALRHSLRPFRLHHVFNDPALCLPPPRALSLMATATSCDETMRIPRHMLFVSHGVRCSHQARWHLAHRWRKNAVANCATVPVGISPLWTYNIRRPRWGGAQNLD